ncbi:MAG TPA: preprotein translocase subunit SecE [Thermomicrobiales bacterium]|nr:preprotein translocase subunit SecE [Thermomicrobiales bacterium]
MSAQRRTATKTRTASRPREDVGAAPVAAAPAKPATPRPPKPVAAERASEPQTGVARRIDDLKENLQETIAEIKKVNWPDRETTRNLTIVVIGMTVALGLLLGGIDFVLQTLFTYLR